MVFYIYKKNDVKYIRQQKYLTWSPKYTTLFGRLQRCYNVETTLCVLNLKNNTPIRISRGATTQSPFMCKTLTPDNENKSFS